ncbi:MAG TPA: hypothetical protein PKD61_11410 [Polyangiaceae bacterium]|nr:hypothetical protein [Polyangiaceae bacterium]
MKLTRSWLQWATLFCLFLAIVLNARGYLLCFDHRALDQRAFDYGWEFVLPFRALRGQWVGRDFVFPIGPAWQLIASVGSSAGKVDAARFVAWLHFVFPVLSLLLVFVLAHEASEQPRGRAFFILVFGIASLHDDVRSFRAVLSLALIVLLMPGRSAGAWRGVATALLALLACLLSLDSALIALASVVATFALSMAALPRLAWLGHLRRMGTALLGVGAVATTALWGLGFSADQLIHGAGLQLRGYSASLVRDPEAYWFLGPGLVLVVQLVVAASLWRSRQRRLSVLLLVALVPMARGLVRSDPEHLWAAMLPALGALLFVAVSVRPRRVERIGSAVVVLGCLGVWLPLDRDRMNAWDYGQWARGVGLRAVELEPPREPHYESDFSRVLRVLSERPDLSCVILPERLLAAHALSGVPGGSRASLRWSPEDADSLSQSLSETADSCPLAITEARSFDLPEHQRGAAFDPEWLTRTRPLYLIGPNLIAAEALAHSTLQRLPLQVPAAERPVGIPGQWSISLPRSVAPTSAIQLHYELRVSELRVLLGGAPWLEAQFFAGDRPIAPATQVAALALNREARAWLPVHPEAAEWRAAFGHTPSTPELRVQADRLVLSLRGRWLSPKTAHLRILGLSEGIAPSRGQTPGVCRATVELSQAVSRGEALSRAVTLRVEGTRLLLPPNPPRTALAETFVPVVPCEDSCLYGEVGVPATGGAAVFEVHAVDGFERPRFIHWQALPGHAPRPFELPLGNYAGRSILLRFGTARAGDLPSPGAAFLRPRVAPCSSMFSVVQALQDEQLDVLRGQAKVSGDRLQLEPAGYGGPPSDARLSLRVPAGSCLAVDLRAEAPSTTPRLDLELGVLEAGQYVPLIRGSPAGAEAELHFEDAALEEWWGRHVQLRFLARGDAAPGTAWGVFARPRLHRCGDGAPWGFAGSD